MQTQNRHRLARWLLCGILLSLSIARADAMLRIASDDWCPFVCAKQGWLTSGFLVDATSRAMALGGYRVEPVLMPLNRAMHETTTGDLEGVYAPPIDNRLRMSQPIAYSRACFYTRVNDTWTYKGMDSLRNLTVGVIDDYGYDNDAMDAYIAKHHSHNALVEFNVGETAGVTNVQKLLGGRYRTALEHQAVMTHLITQLGVGKDVKQAGCLEHALPLTIGFSQGDVRNSHWIDALANGLHQLDVSGELTALKTKYGIPSDTPDQTAATQKPRAK